MYRNFRGDFAPDSPEVLRRTTALAESMRMRGVTGLCPTNCTCSFGSRCGKAYAPSAFSSSSPSSSPALFTLEVDDDDAAANVAPVSAAATAAAAADLRFEVEN